MSFDKLTNRNSFFEQMEKEVLELIDPATRAPFTELVEEVNCPSCNANEKSFFLKKWGFDYHKCQQCDLIYVSPRLTEATTIELYKKGSEANEMWASKVNSSDFQKNYNKSYFKEQVALLKEYADIGKLLDIGCGNGHFLTYARDAGFDVEGVELEESAVEIARSEGLKVRRLLLEDEELNQDKFDIITMFGVLEHLFEPARDVKTVHSMLNEGGVFMGITPNAQSLVGMLLKEKARFYTPRNHPMIFSFSSIRNLFEKNGFKVLHLDTVLTGYDSIINSLQNRDPFDDLELNFLPPKFKELLQDRKRFEQLIRDWDLGLRLRVVVRKL